MKKLLILLILLTCNVANAAVIGKNAKVAVMDLGTHEKTTNTNLNLMNLEKSASEYIIQRLVTKTRLKVMDKEIVREKLKDLDTESLILPDDAKKIGEILGVKYIIYGNVTDFWVEVENTTSTIVKTQIVIRLMDVETGRILMAAKGNGEDSSTYGTILFIIWIGEFQVSEHEVQKALQKAAFKATDVLIERLFKN